MASGQERKLDDSKFCFIACVNDEFLYEESVLYLEQLIVPPGMTVDLLAVRGAPSMTGRLSAGYGGFRCQVQDLYPSGCVYRQQEYFAGCVGYFPE